MSVAFRAIFSNFFEEQSTQNHPQYLSGLSRALFPTTFLEIAVYVRREEQYVQTLELLLFFSFLNLLARIDLRFNRHFGRTSL